MADSERDLHREDDPGESDIKVTDRRLFKLDGTLREELREEDEPAAETPPPRPPRPESDEGESGSGFRRQSLNEPEGVDFTMLLNAMAQPALLFLGEIPNPQTGRPDVDLEQARLQIDMLELLKVKCRGNLSADEDALLDRILYQLRMLYVARSSGPGPA